MNNLSYSSELSDTSQSNGNLSMGHLSSIDLTLLILDRIVFGFSIVVLIMGLVGNALNVFLFTSHRILRRNQCVFYLIMESLVDCCQLSITFTSRLAVTILQYDPTQSSLIWCKIRAMFPQSCTLISMTIVCLAVIDQYFSTHYHLRYQQMSSLHIAHVLVGLTTSFWLLHGIPFILYFEIQTTVGCVISNLEFALYYRYFHLPILIGALPLSIATIFSLLAYRNVRRLIRRQISLLRRRLDRQLTAMVLAKVISMIIVTIPFVLYRIYTLIIVISKDDLWRKQFESFMLNLAFLIFSTNFSGSFYVFFLTSSRFRRQIRSTLSRRYLRKLYSSIHICRFLSGNNQVAPIDHVSDVSI